MFDFKEYTKMRDIAQKRIKRAQEKGVALFVHVPTVKELRALGDERITENAFRQLENYLSSGYSLSRQAAAERVTLTEEERILKRRKQQRDYRRRKVARALERPEFPNKYQSYLKGIARLGVDVPPSKLPAFFAYMDFRFSQGAKGEKKYVFDIFVEDFQKMLEKGFNPNQIKSDFEKFEADQAVLEARSGAITGMDYDKATQLWDRFIDRE